jgi:thiol-disulfide isomerase/thioredoxin
MAESGHLEEPAAGGARRGFLRRWVYPLLVIAAIAGVIWWIDYRPRGSESPGGERYGPVSLPAELAPPGVSVAAKEGSLAPDFLLQGLQEGTEYRLSDFRGHPVVLNFWATWCAPCRKEIPQLVQAYQKYRDQGLVVIGLNHAESRSIVRPYAEKFGMDFPIAIDLDGEMWDRYKLLGLPTTFFIDRDGFIRSIYMGPFVAQAEGKNVQGAIEESELEKRIAEILGPASGGGGQ